MQLDSLAERTLVKSIGSGAAGATGSVLPHVEGTNSQTPGSRPAGTHELKSNTNELSPFWDAATITCGVLGENQRRFQSR
jgi:hypothetical protein